MTTGRLSRSTLPLRGLTISQFLDADEFVGYVHHDMKEKIVRGRLNQAVSELRADPFVTEKGVTLSSSGRFAAFIGEAFDAPPGIFVVDLKAIEASEAVTPIPGNVVGTEILVDMLEGV
ncbi:MAG: hypothetical protein RLN85_20655, partial [Pseudomonadales bacterium]